MVDMVDAVLVPTEVSEEQEGWAEEEFGAAALGDARLTARLVRLASAVGSQPGASLPQACGGDPGATKAAYRFFANDALAPAALLTSHVATTYARIQQGAVERVLAVQDTTYLDFTRHPATTGLGPLAHAYQQGLLAHTTLALTPERVPLGVLAQEVWARDPATYGQGAPDGHKARPIEEKESRKWLTSLAAVAAARAACPATPFVSVGDREADVYELFAAPRPAGVDLLVRAEYDRRVHERATPARRLRATVAAALPVATLTVAVPRRGTQPAREATLTMRTCAVTLRPPRRDPRARTPGERLPPVRVWAVWAHEATPPAGVAALDWLLLTTCLVETPADAIERVAWYACRWGIELLHKVLKSGCRIEARQLAAADRLERCLALYTVVAWRVLYATLLARVLPAAPCTALLEADEWQALYCHTHRITLLPAAPPTLRAAVRWLGRLGGFLGRKGDGEPGPMALWRGLQRLYDLTDMYRIMRLPEPRTCG